MNNLYLIYWTITRGAMLGFVAAVLYLLLVVLFTL